MGVCQTFDLDPATANFIQVCTLYMQIQHLYALVIQDVLSFEASGPSATALSDVGILGPYWRPDEDLYQHADVCDAPPSVIDQSGFIKIIGSNAL